MCVDCLLVGLNKAMTHTTNLRTFSKIENKCRTMLLFFFPDFRIGRLSALGQTNSKQRSTTHFTVRSTRETQKRLDFKRDFDSVLLEGSPSENCNSRKRTFCETNEPRFEGFDPPEFLQRSVIVPSQLTWEYSPRL